jgi:phosphoglycolate phosphatase
MPPRPQADGPRDGSRDEPRNEPRARPLLAFDLDGCLVDSDAAITEAYGRALRAVDVEPPPARELTWVIGPPLSESFGQVLEAAGVPAHARTEWVARAVEVFRARYAVTSRTETALHDGMVEVLEAVAPHARLVVVTSKVAPAARGILEVLDLDRHLEALYAPEEHAPGEPKTETLARAMEELGANPEDGRVVMIGDRRHDIDAGRANGTATVGVTWGSGSPEELEEAGADRSVDTPAERSTVLLEFVRSGSSGPAGRLGPNGLPGSPRRTGPTA